MERFEIHKRETESQGLNPYFMITETYVQDRFNTMYMEHLEKLNKQDTPNVIYQRI